MKITVASGKGGTGKTTVATSLALSLAAGGTRPLFLDCDVEAPNAHLFLAPTVDAQRDVHNMVPHIRQEQCSLCGECANVCQFHALAVIGKRVMVFPQLCHGCGSCSLICPNQSITEEPIKIGALEQGHTTSGIIFGRGVLNPGEPMAVPIIRQLKQWMKPQSSQTLIIDAPPGTSCPVVEAMRGADIVLLVAEPTPFGLHDLRLAVGVARELDIPVGVIVNRDGIGDDRVDTFCEEENLPILLRIPFDRALAEGIARGLPLIDISPGYEDAFRILHRQAADIVHQHHHQHHDEHRYYQPAVSHQKGERV